MNLNMKVLFVENRPKYFLRYKHFDIIADIGPAHPKLYNWYAEHEYEGFIRRK